MPPSPCPSNTDPTGADGVGFAAPPPATRGVALALAALAAVALPACPDDDAECGAGDAPPAAVAVSGEGQAFSFGPWLAGANNDCPAPAPPAGVVSLTVYGPQATPAGTAFVSLCLPRPDLVAAGDTLPLDPHNQPALDADRVHVVDVQADLGDGCRWTLDGAAAPTGTATFDGYCGQGIEPEGWALRLDGTVTVIETCPGAADRTLQVTLSGEAAVAPM